VDVPFTDLTVGTGDGVPDADGVGVADADEAGVADGVGVGLAFACAAAPSRLALPVSSTVRLVPALPRSTSALVEAFGDAFALAVDDEVACGEAPGDGVPDAVPEGDGVGIGVAALAAFGASNCTWRNSSSAVWLTSLTTFCEFWPGTDTVMMLVPCGTTFASVKPALFTRLNMICCAVVISACVTFEPCTGTARSETLVPLVRSRPRCTRNA
jgi:hypothetical protein